MEIMENKNEKENYRFRVRSCQSNPLMKDFIAVAQNAKASSIICDADKLMSVNSPYFFDDLEYTLRVLKSEDIKIFFVSSMAVLPEPLQEILVKKGIYQHSHYDNLYTAGKLMYNHLLAKPNGYRVLVYGRPADVGIFPEKTVVEQAYIGDDLEEEIKQFCPQELMLGMPITREGFGVSQKTPIKKDLMAILNAEKPLFYSYSFSAYKEDFLNTRGVVDKLFGTIMGRGDMYNHLLINFGLPQYRLLDVIGRDNPHMQWERTVCFGANSIVKMVQNAALDRNHPRRLLSAYMLSGNIGVTERIIRANPDYLVFLGNHFNDMRVANRDLGRDDR